MENILYTTLEVVQAFIQALPLLLIHPLFYLAVVAVFLRNAQLVRQERQRFNVSLHAPVVRSIKMLFTGLAAGILGSILLIGLGATVHWQDSLFLWALVLLAFLLGGRKVKPIFLAIGLMGLVVLLSSMLPEALVLGSAAPLQPIWAVVQQVYLPSWFAVAGLLMLIEAYLLRKKPGRNAFAYVERGKRGGWTGGYRMEGWWPLPLFLLMPVPEGTVGAWNGWPFWSRGELAFQIIPMPVFLGLAFSSVKLTVEEVAKQAAVWRLAGGILLLVLAAVAQWSFWLQWLAVAALLLLEAALWGMLRWSEEKKGAPFQPDGRGVKVLAVVPESPAEKMGVLPGEVVVRINGQQVVDEPSMYRALQQNPAYCRLEVLDIRGELRVLQRAIYQGEHHQLGIVAVPGKAQGIEL